MAYTGYPPGAWAFGHSAQNKPFVAEPAACRGLRFNLSHTSGRVMFALRTGGEIGVDVERFTRGLDIAEVGRIVLSPPELAALQVAPATDQPRQFLRYWVLKEAILKALGLGFSLDPQSITVDLRGAAARVAALDGPADTQSQWALWDGTFDSGHGWAVAVPDPAPGDEPPTIRCFRF